MDGNVVIEWIVAILVLFGTAMSLLSSFGLLRLPDVYNRAHATTKAATLGILAILLGAFIYFFFSHGVSSIRLLLGIVFVFLTAPVAGHLIIRSAHRYGSPLAPISVQDDLQELQKNQKEVDDEKVRPVEAES
ncbi:Na+/H+ antiporter subunit G [Paenibacillus montaniterrae]|uniref:Na+/H+ antiporter subunit G n=1 Tax=Paenibacillus montaniterrae TaxID=429341 RepID=A0A919YLV0_9BACL|nr:Na+/H+ antiporter subunit G [Paenibacillus montaniterrae]